MCARCCAAAVAVTAADPVAVERACRRLGGRDHPRFLQTYAVERVKLEAERRGELVTEAALDDGSVQVRVRLARLPDRAQTVVTATGVYERVRLATFEVNLFVPRYVPERRVDQILALLNNLDLRRHIEETVVYHLRSRSFLKIVTAEVDE
jgi:hypothetical protein